MATITNIFLKLEPMFKKSMTANHAYSVVLTFATVTESIPSLKSVSL